MKKASAAETAITVQQEALPSHPAVVLEGDPDAQLAYAQKAAAALMKVVSQKKNPVMIRGKQYLEYGDWQVLGRFYGATVEVEWTRELPEGRGYEARVLVKRQGEVISSAEGMCTRDEKNSNGKPAIWANAADYAVRSMAQTRTAAKALRNAFGWVAELAGYSATPAEEMPRDDQPQQQTIAVFERAKQMIERATDPAVLNDYWKKVSGSPKYTPEQKETIEGLIAARVQTLEKAGAETTIDA